MLRLCSGLNGDLPKGVSICECDLIWKKGLYRYNLCKNLKMISFRIRVSSKFNDGNLYKRQRHIQREGIIKMNIEIEVMHRPAKEDPEL